MKIFLCGDVMTARGIDQALPHPCSPVLHESYVDSAIDYLRLAERANGRVLRPVDFAYVWGAALDEWLSARPHARIVNLETSITHSEAFEPKGINYRMSPKNALCLTAAALDCCVLANNHVLDWGLDGLLDTLNTLERLQIRTAGAGRNLAEAKAPAIIEVPDEGRLLVLALASETSGVPRHWAADAGKAGVNLYPLFPRRQSTRSSMSSLTSGGRETSSSSQSTGGRTGAIRSRRTNAASPTPSSTKPVSPLFTATPRITPKRSRSTRIVSSYTAVAIS